MKLIFSLIFIVLLNFNSVGATPQAGSCADSSFKFITDPKDEQVIDTTIPVRVLRQDVPLYVESTGSEQKSLLNFDERFKPLKQQGQRIQIGDNSKSALGWVDKVDLLCNFIPLSENGLPRKAFVKVPTSANPEYGISAYPSPEGTVCNNDKCQTLRRFQVYFIFSEDTTHQRFLVSSVYNLGSSESNPLVGWVKAGEVIQWKTNLGIRPKYGENEKVSGYLSLEDSGKPESERKAGVELLGGKEWYSFPLHIPLLSVEQGHYKIAAPGVGMMGFRSSTSGLRKLNDVDIFFLLDGTASMDPFIQATKQTIKEILEVLKSSEKDSSSKALSRDLREAHFRCGFLIYRDHYADKNAPQCSGGLCEQLSLSSNTCKGVNEMSCEDAIERLDKVQASVDDKDDYEELLFDGLKKSMALMAPCPQRNKLLIVIGDHGDRADSLQPPVIDEMKRLNITPFFIQPKAVDKQDNGYQRAYNKFRSQTRDIIGRRMEGIDDPQKFFLSLHAEETPKRIATDFLNRNVSPAVVSELEMILATGESVRGAVEKSKKQGEMSLLFWESVEESACKNLPEQCDKAVNHRVNEFFIPKDDEKFEQELLITEQNLDKWQKLLKPLIDLNRPMSASEKKRTLQKLIIESIQNVLGDPPITAVDNEKPLAEIILEKKLALPVRPQSPLFQYSLADFDPNNDNSVVDCEVTRILEWVKDVYNILDRIRGYPFQKVTARLEEYRHEDCAGLSDKGKRIKKVPPTVGGEETLGPDRTYSYGHALPPNSVILYWIPLEFLP